jgi:hypothetical protein
LLVGNNNRTLHSSVTLTCSHSDLYVLSSDTSPLNTAPASVRGHAFARIKPTRRCIIPRRTAQLGRIWRIRHDELERRGSFALPTLARIPRPGEAETPEAQKQDILSTKTGRLEGSRCLLWVIHDRCIQYPCRSMSVVTPIATLLFGAAK